MKLNATLARRGALVALAASVAACGQNVLVGGKDQSGATPDSGNAKDDAAAETDGGEILCGSTKCSSVDVGGGLGVRQPCCYDFSRCGARLPNLCLELDSPGTMDPACPTVTSYPGCCRPNGSCGLLLTGRLGCIDPFGTVFPTAVLPTCVPKDQ